MFTHEFAKVPSSEIAGALKCEGFYIFENALTREYVSEILSEVDFNGYLANSNNVGVVSAGEQKFLSHCLAKSKRTFDVITSKMIRDVCRHYFTDKYKLTNQRIYKTHTAAHMPWHTDNNRQTGNTLTSKHSMPGLLFMFYLTDVTENPFQLVKGSHRWSPKRDEIYLADEFIDENYAKDILTVSMGRGTFIACDINVVHRAEPFKNRDYERVTLLFQVDQIGKEREGHGEELLVNTAFVDDTSEEVLQLLGFGVRADYPAFPTTSAASMSIRDLLGLQRQMGPLIFQSIIKNVIKGIVPTKTITSLKRMKWKLREKGDSFRESAS